MNFDFADFWRILLAEPTAFMLLLKSTLLFLGFVLSGYMSLRVAFGVMNGLKARRLIFDLLFLFLAAILFFGSLYSLFSSKPF